MDELTSAKMQMRLDECEHRKWPHNNRCRYENGFQCEDCGTFFPLDSMGYKRYEYPSTLWMAIWNLSAKSKKDKENTISILLNCCDYLYELQDEPLLETIAYLEYWLTVHGVPDVHAATTVTLRT
jgi:hypothetical protein